MTRETLAAVVMVWLIGALVGWFVGWMARGEQNRAWGHNLARQLAEARAQLDEVLEQLDDAQAQLDEDGRARWAPAPAVVHVHTPPPLPWTPGVAQLAGPTTAQSLATAKVRALDVVPVEGAES